jgi:hypothetical protein
MGVNQLRDVLKVVVTTHPVPLVQIKGTEGLELAE